MITGLLSQITFMHPALLATLLALPVLWYILRITPPAPKTLFFPAARFLKNLHAEEQTSAQSPWWILLLRLLMAALIILALARPVMNPAEGLSGQGVVRVVIDNSWASAQLWSRQTSAAEEIITQAGREKREIYLLPTAAALGAEAPKQHGPVSAGEALSILRGVSPHPWPAQYDTLIETVETQEKAETAIHTVWLGHGLDEGGAALLAKTLQRQGSVHYVRPSNEKLPVILRPAQNSASKGQKEGGHAVRINVDAPSDIANQVPVAVKALAQGNDLLDVQSTVLTPGTLPKTVSFEIIESLKPKITQFRITGRNGAGGVFLIDDQYKKRAVGIAAPAQEASSAPLIEESYYVQRALEPYADITLGDVDSLIKDNVSVIILPDIAAMPADTLNDLQNWVKEGGLLLRFAGPNMTEIGSEQFLLPVTLRAGGRSLSGSLSWTEPQTIAPFPEGSPLYGLNVSGDITIRQQVLADPGQDMEGKVWATLSDGTPFITAATEDQGLLVLIHTTANTQWSDFALSGLYVSTLKRIVQLAGQSATQKSFNFTSLDPILVMDGYGGLTTPSAAIDPINAENLDTLVPSAKHPPGLYGRGHMQYALNLGTNLPALSAMKNLPASVAQSYYDTDYEIDIMPYLLYAALMLFCLDWLIMIFVVGKGLPRLPKKILPVLVFAAITVTSGTSYAAEQKDIQYASGFYLAYVKTGDGTLDAMAQRGLETLAETLTRRTSVEPKGVVGVNPETDTLAFFPLLYWPISEAGTAYSGKAMSNIQSYLDHGGTILFDTRDQNRGTRSFHATPKAKKLRQITAALNVPPIAPIPDDHVLGRSFYLLDKYPGRYSEGTLWVEPQTLSGRDNVSSIMVGSNDWIGSWADSASTAQHGRFRSYDNRQQEMALRFGVNLVMYVLTGNYKADQVHIPHILERLGR